MPNPYYMTCQQTVHAVHQMLQLLTAMRQQAISRPKPHNQACVHQVVNAVQCIRPMYPTSLKALIEPKGAAGLVLASTCSTHAVFRSLRYALLTATCSPQAQRAVYASYCRPAFVHDNALPVRLPSLGVPLPTQCLLQEHLEQLAVCQPNMTSNSVCLPAAVMLPTSCSSMTAHQNHKNQSGHPCQPSVHMCTATVGCISVEVA